MPTYEYECSACGHRFDELQSFSDPPLTKCPKCKKSKLTRLFGGGGAIIFKGSGFYETDYRRAGETKANGTADGDSSGTKTETKTEAKADSAGTAAPADTSAGASKNGSGGKSESKGGAKKAK